MEEMLCNQIQSALLGDGDLVLVRGQRSIVVQRYESAKYQRLGEAHIVSDLQLIHCQQPSS
jgi:hypothetical protein